MNCFHRDKKKNDKKKDAGSEKGTRSKEDLLSTGCHSDMEECPIQQALRELFQMFEMNGERVIVVTEIGKIMTLLGMDPTEMDVRKAIASIKKDEFGLVRYSDYSCYMKRLIAKQDDPEYLRQEDKLLQAFRTLDKEKSGYLDKSYLSEVLCGRGDVLTDTELQDLIRMSGTDNGGLVNYTELVKLWCQKTNNHG